MRIHEIPFGSWKGYDQSHKLTMAELRAGGLSLDRQDLRGRSAVLDFRGLSARDCKLTGENLAYRDMSGGSFSRSSFDDVVGTETRWVKAELAGATFVDAKLDCANFDSANLTRANLIGAHVHGATFRASILTLAHCYYVHFGECIFAETVATDLRARKTKWGDAVLQKSDFRFSNLAQSHWDKCRIHACWFSKCDLSGAFFTQTTILQTSFIAADLRCASFAGSTLIGCNFTGARTLGTDWSEVTFENCSFGTNPAKWPELPRCWTINKQGIAVIK